MPQADSPESGVGITSFLIYGANGYVGEAASELSLAHGLRPVLAARDTARLEPLARRLGVECRQMVAPDLRNWLQQQRT
jgi:short subunit dehydrogenase-like uncharacterized protein